MRTLTTGRRYLGHVGGVEILLNLRSRQRLLAQVEVAEKDQPRTAFTTPGGLFQFWVMPFGLCNAPATFQRLMDRVLSGLKWSSCLVYFDDIIVVGMSFSDQWCVCKAQGGGAEAKTSEMPPLPETCRISRAHRVS